MVFGRVTDSSLKELLDTRVKMKTKPYWALILFLFSFAPAFVFGAPVTTWRPSAISISLLSGTLRSVVVRFSTSQSLQNVDLAVVSGIAPYVSVVPSHLDQVTSGRTYTVQLVFSVAQNAQVGVYSGTLQLRIFQEVWVADFA
jgi:hypothetical protein